MAKENIGRELCMKKRPVIRFGLGDLKRFMMHMLSMPAKNWRARRLVMLWTTLLFFTGMRPGEAAFSRGYSAEGHYLHVKNLTIRRLEEDLYGSQFSVVFEVGWLKHHRYRGEVVTRQLVSLTDPKLFYIDPTLHCIAHLYWLGCFGSGTLEEIFGRDVLIFPLSESTKEIPIFTGRNKNKPASASGMNRLFKQFAFEAGFPSNVTSYSLRRGFVRDLFSRGMPVDAVKKLLHHTPNSTEAVGFFFFWFISRESFRILFDKFSFSQRRHYEGDLTNLDIVAIRANVPQRSAENLDTFDMGHIFSYVCLYVSVLG